MSFQTDVGRSNFNQSDGPDMSVDTRKKNVKSSMFWRWLLVGAIAAAAVYGIFIFRKRNRDKKAFATRQNPSEGTQHGTDVRRSTPIPGKLNNLAWDEFRGWVDSPPQKSIIMVHSQNCGHCKRAMPAFAAAAEKSPNTMFGAFEVSKAPPSADTDIPWYRDIAGVPTFAMFNKGNKNPSFFSQERTTANFVSAAAGLQ